MRFGLFGIFDRCLSRFLEGVDDEADDCDADAGIGDVKGGPRVRQRHVQIEEQKIDDVTVRETIGQVSHDASQEQTKRQVSQQVWRAPPDQEREHKNERDAGEHDKKGVVVLKRAEGGAVVRHVDETEEIGDDGMEILRIDVAEHEPFRELVQRVKREREKEDEFHSKKRTRNSATDRHGFSRIETGTQISPVRVSSVFIRGKKSSRLFLRRVHAADHSFATIA